MGGGGVYWRVSSVHMLVSVVSLKPQENGHRCVCVFVFLCAVVVITSLEITFVIVS